MKATCYLTLEPEFRSWGSSPRPLVGFHVSKVTKRPPDPRSRGVVVELSLDVPAAAFEPLRPVVDVEIGMNDVTIHVGVEPPAEPGGDDAA